MAKESLPGTLQANNTASDGSVDPIIQQMVTSFTDASSALNAIPVGSGSTTVQPTNVELSRVFGETLQYVRALFPDTGRLTVANRNLATGLSGLQAQGTVPSFGNSVSQLDPAVAGTATALNTTLPGSLGFVHIL